MERAAIQAVDALADAVRAQLDGQEVMKTVGRSRRKQRRAAAARQHVAYSQMVLHAEGVDMAHVDAAHAVLGHDVGEFLGAADEAAEGVKFADAAPQAEVHGGHVREHDLAQGCRQDFVEPAQLGRGQALGARVEHDEARAGVIEEIVRFAEQRAVHRRMRLAVGTRTIVIADDGEVRAAALPCALQLEEKVLVAVRLALLDHVAELDDEVDLLGLDCLHLRFEHALAVEKLAEDREARGLDVAEHREAHMLGAGRRQPRQALELAVRPPARGQACQLLGGGMAVPVRRHSTRMPPARRNVKRGAISLLFNSRA